MALSRQQQNENLRAVIFGGADHGPHRCTDASELSQPIPDGQPCDEQPSDD